MLFVGAIGVILLGVIAHRVAAGLLGDGGPALHLDLVFRDVEIILALLVVELLLAFGLLLSLLLFATATPPEPAAAAPPPCRPRWPPSRSDSCSFLTSWILTFFSLLPVMNIPVFIQMELLAPVALAEHRDIALLQAP